LKTVAAILKIKLKDVMKSSLRNNCSNQNSPQRNIVKQAAALIIFAAVLITETSHAQTDSIHVNSSGDVGIGTDTPTEKLDVDGNVQTYGSDRSLVFRNPSYNENYLAQIIGLGYNSGNEWFERAAMRFKPTDAGWNRGGYVDFFTKKEGYGHNSSLRLRIDDNGDLYSFGPERKLVFKVNGYSEQYMGQIVALGDASGGIYQPRAAMRFASAGPYWARGAHIDFHTRGFNQDVDPFLRMRVAADGQIEIHNVPGAAASGLEDICRNNVTKELVSCNSSSLRLKSNIKDYVSGVNVVTKLKPVTYKFKDSKAQEVGLIAEDVAKVDPLLATYLEDGTVQGVKYRQLAMTLINAVKEQQSQLMEQQKQIAELSRMVSELKSAR